jgi:hypothetical protein
MEKYNIKFELSERVKKYNSSILTNSNRSKSDIDIMVYLLENKLKQNKCGICNINPIWNGKSLELILDRINNIKTDNNLDNLRLVCPNCISQLKKKSTIFTKIKTPTTNCIDCGKKIKHQTKKNKDKKFLVFRCTSCLELAICKTVITI